MPIAAAIAQPTGDTAKFQPAILNLRSCIMSNAPPANIAGVRSMDDALEYFQPRCFGAFSDELIRLGAGDAAPGGFRLMVRDEWIAFQMHLGRR